MLKMLKIFFKITVKHILSVNEKIYKDYKKKIEKYVL